MRRLMALVLLGSLLVVNERGDTIARVQERLGDYVDLFGPHSERLGWGLIRGRDVELFDQNSRRIGTWHRDRGVIRLERK